MSIDFGKMNSLKQKTSWKADNIPTSALNLEQLASMINIPRDTIDKIISKVLYVLGRCVREGRVISMLIHKIASISISNSELKCEFITEFINDFRSSQDTTTSSHNYSGTNNSIKNATNTRSSNNTTGNRAEDIDTLQKSNTVRNKISNNVSNVIQQQQQHQQQLTRPRSAQSMRSNSTASTSINNFRRNNSNINTNSNASMLRKDNLDLLNKQSENRGKPRPATGGMNRNGEGMFSSLVGICVVCRNVAYFYSLVCNIKLL